METTTIFLRSSAKILVKHFCRIHVLPHHINGWALADAHVSTYLQYACSPNHSDDGNEEPSQDPNPRQHDQSPIEAPPESPEECPSQEPADESQHISEGEETRHRCNEVPQKLRQFWETNTPDDLKQFMVSPDDVFQPTCMNPRPELLKLMCSKAKCMELLPKEDPGLMYLPTYGATMCWIAMGGTGELPGHIQEVLYFFCQVANSLGNYAHYVVPTTVTELEVIYSVIN